MINTNNTLISVKGLKKYFPIYSKGFRKKKIGDVKAVNDVSFDIVSGETLGIVGESGCGKTTTARTILRALDPTEGEVIFKTSSGDMIDIATLDEKALKPLRKEMQMIFQDPFSSLNPRMTVGDIIAEPLVIHNIDTKKDRIEKVIEILKKVGLKPEHRVRYPHAFSGGQRQRIGIARALILNPAFVICDEAVSALDVSVQAQVINLLEDLQQEMKLTYIFVAHDLSVVKHICTHVAVMYAGKIVEIGPTDSIFEDPKHPYTKALMAAVPHIDPDIKIDYILQGEVADVSNLPAGCAFHPRCAECTGDCKNKIPKLKEHDDRFISCMLYDTDRSLKC